MKNPDGRPLLSIVIPVYEREKMVEELLASLPDRQDIEVIVVDDHSPAPVRPANPFARAKLTTVLNQEGQKFAGTARNTGLDLARGTWVMLMDSDDQVRGEALSRVLDQVASEPSWADKDVIYTYSESFDCEGGAGMRHHATNWIVARADRTGDDRYFAHYAPPWGKLIRLDFIKEKGLRFDAVRLSNDVMFGVRLFVAAPRAGIIAETVYRIRQGHASLTTELNVDAIVMRMDVLRDMNAFLDSHGYRALRLPLWVQLHKIYKAAPGVSLKEIWKSIKLGQPILITPLSLKKKILKVIDKRLMRYPM